MKLEGCLGFGGICFNVCLIRSVAPKAQEPPKDSVRDPNKSAP